jgi:hypothetical protein
VYNAFGNRETYSSDALAMTTGWTIRARFPAAAKYISISISSRTYLGPNQYPIEWVLRAITSGVKRLGCEAVHSCLYSAEVKNDGAIPSRLHIFLWRGT